MAITRCPYCHSLVDETSKYCQNCGTQLLFPEDEKIEEEIPGEKIIDVEEEEEEEPGTVEIEEEKLEEAEDEGKEAEEEEAEEITLIEEIERLESGHGTEVAREPESAETTQVLEPGPAAVEAETQAVEVEAPAVEAEAEPVTEKPETGAVFEAAQPAEPEKAEEEAEEEKEETRLMAEPEPEAEAGPWEATPSAEARGETPAEEPAAAETVAGGAEAGAKLGTFDTRELEDIGKTTDLGRMRLDRLFDEIMEDREERRKAEAAPEEEPKKSSGTLPPWADAMIRGGETPSAGEAVGERPSPGTDERFTPSALAEEAERELEARSTTYGAEREDAGPAGKRPRSDSTIGLPEKVTPLSIPFETEEAEVEEAGEEESFLPAEEAEEEEELEKEKEAGAPCEAAETTAAERPAATARDITEKPFEAEKAEAVRPFSFSTFIKSRLFDILFVGVFWLVGLWLAAHSMGATIFDLLAVTARPLLVFLAILIAVYIFLFKFFLGETLGDRLFRERE
jgi:hypothetical protein